jgi:putative polyhydroxyalkanoate system protein
MADIHIHREHRLGLAKARKTAWRWAELAEEKFGLECTVIEGETHDVVEFRRAGLEGRLVVEASAFDLTARLGLLLGAFRGQIEEGIEDNLDRLLASAAAAKKSAPARAPGTKTSARKP